MNVQSQSGLKGTPAYMAPEILRNGEYSKAGDVYAFGLIVFEIMTGEFPFKNDNQIQLMTKLVNGYRPTISTDVPYSYRELIEKCWSEEASKRPSFDDIVTNLKENKLFITEIMDEAEYYEYVDFIDNYQSTFDISKRIIHFSEFIESQGKNKNIQKFVINKTEPNEYEMTSTLKSLNSPVQNKYEKTTEDKSALINTSHTNQLKIAYIDDK